MLQHMKAEHAKTLTSLTLLSVKLCLKHLLACVLPLMQISWCLIDRNSHSNMLVHTVWHVCNCLCECKSRQEDMSVSTVMQFFVFHLQKLYCLHTQCIAGSLSVMSESK